MSEERRAAIMAAMEAANELQELEDVVARLSRYEPEALKDPYIGSLLASMRDCLS